MEEQLLGILLEQLFLLLQIPPEIDDSASLTLDGCVQISQERTVELVSAIDITLLLFGIIFNISLGDDILLRWLVSLLRFLSLVVSLPLLGLVHHSNIILDWSIRMVSKILHIYHRFQILIIPLRHLALPVNALVKSLEVVLHLLVDPLVDAVGVLPVSTIELFPLNILLLEVLDQHLALSFPVKTAEIIVRFDIE